MAEQSKPPEAPSELPPPGVRPDSGQVEEKPPGGMGWRPEKQRPSMGRIVLYRHDLYQDNNGCAPAIITGVRPEGSVSLTVFFRGQSPYSFDFVEEGPEEGQYMWPPRV